MAKINFNTQQDTAQTKKRWQRIMDLPENTTLWDISTGKYYKRGMFKALHRDGFENVVNDFQIIGTDETVYVPFLRLVGDLKECSLMKKP